MASNARGGPNVKNEYINLLPWKRRKPDEELGLDDDNWSEAESHFVGARTPSYYSISEGDLYFLRLTGDESEIDYFSLQTKINQQLMMALEEKDLETVENCLQNGADANVKHGAYQVPPLHLATALGFTEGVDALMRAGADVTATDSRGVTPLHVAAASGEAVLIQKYVTAGAVIDAQDLVKENGAGEETPLHRAAAAGHSAAVVTLLSLGAKSNPIEIRGRTPLHLAAQKGAAGCIQALLHYDADPNAVDYRGATALLLLGGAFVTKERCRTSGYKESVQILVKGGAKVNVQDRDTNVTPLHQAATLRRLEAVKALLAAGAKVNAQDHEGTTPLHISALKGHANAIRSMIAVATVADINLPDFQNRTALHKAAYRGSAECINLLLKAGADLGAKTNAGVSAATLILQLPNGAKILSQRFDAAITSNSVDSSEFACRLKFDYSVLLTQHKSQQMSVIEDVLDESRSLKTAELLQHPLVESFLFLKWRKTRYIFFSFIFFYLVLVLGVTIFVLAGVVPKNKNPNQCLDPESRTGNSTNVEEEDLNLGRLQLCLSVIILIIIGQEVIQFSTLHIQYLREAESWIKFGALTTSTAIIFAHSKDDWVLHTSALAVLLGWTEVTLLLGRLPIFGVYPLMFYAVAEHLVKFISVFFFFLAGFAFSFHIIFTDKPAFHYPWTALLRTVAMLLGDMDFDGYFFDDNKCSSVSIVGTAHVIYFFFMIFASLVLMNLLIGLAVNDIQGLQKEGRIKRLRKQAQFIVYLEDMAFSRIVRAIFRDRTSAKLKSWIDQETVMYVHPAVRKPAIRLPATTVERALTVAQEGKAPAAKVSIQDVYNVLQEYSAAFTDVQQRIQNLERYVRGESPSEDHIDGQRLSQLDDDGDSKEHDDLDSNEEADQVDGKSDAIRSLRTDIDDIKGMLKAIMSTSAK